MWTRARRLVAVGVVVFLAGGVSIRLGGAQEAQAPTPPFTATAAANVMRGVLTIPGGPLSDTLFDGPGPTAQVEADSIGTSRGYAAFPDPGQFVVSIPGLAAGMLSQGGGGFPPIDLPPLPEYPFVARSDGTTRPEQVFGDGPYSLSARSAPDETHAEAIVGVRMQALGNAALARAYSSVVVDDGAVVVEAVSSVEGITIGPLTIGEVRSSSQIRLADGVLTPTNKLEIGGLRIAGILVSIRPDGLAVDDIAVPVPIAEVLRPVLSAAGITLEIIPGKVTDERVASQALRVTMPLELAGVGTRPGSLTLIIGESIVNLEAAPGGLVDIPAPSDTDLGALEPAADAPAASGLGSPNLPLASPVAPVPSGQTAAQPQAPLADPELIGLFDVGSTYLTLAGAAAAALAMVHIVRILGVRRPWASIDG